MQKLTFDDIRAMKGNGSSMRTVLKNFIDRGATIYLLHETVGEITERFFIVEYEDLRIPLRAYKLNFYSVLNSALAQRITSDKQKSAALLNLWQIPTPQTQVVTEDFDFDTFIQAHRICVVKPSNGAHGDGITLNIEDGGQARRAAEHARQYGSEVLIQQLVQGYDHRLLFINYQFVAAVRREPASITGDGTRTIQQLVEANNEAKGKLWEQIRSGEVGADEVRGSISKTPVEEIIAARGEPFLNSVPAQGEKVQLLDKANVSLGGQTVDVTSQVNQELSDKISTLLRAIGLSVCGVDVMSEDITAPLAHNKSYVIELNSAPGLRLHELPMVGEARPVCAMVADSLIEYYRGVGR